MRTAPRLTRSGLAAGLTAALAASALGLSALPAAAAMQQVEDVTFSWAISNEAGNSAYDGSCNFLVAGVAGDHGRGQRTAWADLGSEYIAQNYRSQAGNVAIRKPDGSAGWTTPTFATRCAGAQFPPGSDGVSNNEVVFSAGTGQVDLDAGTAEISWTGGVTIAMYGGLTYWSFADPTLSVAADGTGVMTATATGFASDMADAGAWEPIAPRQIEIAQFTDLELTEEGFTQTPSYLGRALGIDPYPFESQSTGGANWGAFPDSWVDFNIATG